jgi:hypothetical protein
MKSAHVAFTLHGSTARVIVKRSDGRRVVARDYPVALPGAWAEWRALQLAIGTATEHVPGEAGQSLHLYSDLDVLRKVDPPLLAEFCERGDPDEQAILRVSLAVKRDLMAFWPGLWECVKVEKERVR